MKTRSIDVKPGDVFAVNIPADGGDPTMTKNLKPHEETWAAVEVTYDQTEIEVVDSEVRIAISFYEPSRARLASQAPAMARLLLETTEDGRPIEDWRERVAVVLRAAGVLP